MTTKSEPHGWAEVPLDLDRFNRFNLYPLASGEMAVRPGLRKLKSFAATSKIVACRSIKHPYSEEVWHYFVDFSTVDGCVVRILDEAFTEIQKYETGINSEPITANIIVVADQVLVTSPSFATAWGHLGDGLVQATPKDSINQDNTPAMPIPAGISVSWVGRAVIGDGQGIKISDALEPRTFTGANTVRGPWASNVYGLHVTEQGALVVISDTGVYALHESAAAAQVILGEWHEITQYSALDFDDTAVARGELWGLTRRGLRRLSPEGEEMRISEFRIPRKYGPRVHISDYRDAKIISGQDGPMVALRDRLFTMDRANNHFGWWSAPNETTWRIVGTLYDHRGGEMLVSESDVFRVEGNFDGAAQATTANEDATAVTGGYAGSVGQPPNAQMTVRKVRFAADGVGPIKVAVRGEEKTRTPNRNGIVIDGANSWSDGNTLEDADLEPAEVGFRKRVQEITLELATEGPRTRVGRSANLRGVALGRKSS